MLRFVLSSPDASDICLAAVSGTLRSFGFQQSSAHGHRAAMRLWRARQSALSGPTCSERHMLERPDGSFFTNGRIPSSWQRRSWYLRSLLANFMVVLKILGDQLDGSNQLSVPDPSRLWWAHICLPCPVSGKPAAMHRWRHSCL